MAIVNQDSISPIHFLRYWRQSRADAEIMALSRLQLNQEELIPTLEIAQGNLPADVTTRLFEKANQTKVTEAGLLEKIPVLVAPIVMRQCYQHAKQSAYREEKALLPVWIPAQINLDGVLSPRAEEELPWLCRDLLEPTTQDFSLGELALMDAFLTHNIIARDENEKINWLHLLQYASDLLNAASNKEWQTALEEAGYELLNVALVKYDDGVRKVSQHILKVYDHLLTQADIPSLLKTYAQITDMPKTSTFNQWQQIKQSEKHLGHVSHQYSLSPSQREAIGHVMELKHGELLAINGPPGTGKTTLLHDIIASLWIQAAIKGTRPPVMVVSSTNNQAVTNVLDSLRAVNAVERWLPDKVAGLGLYLVNSSAKQKEANVRGYHWLSKVGNSVLGLYNEIENPEYLAHAKTFFVQKCSDELNTEFSTVQQATAGLRSRLQEKQALLIAGIKVAELVYTIADKIKQKYQVEGGVAKYRKTLEKQLIELKATIDVTLKISQAWQTFYKKRSWWINYLGFLPGISAKRRLLNAEFLAGYLQFKPFAKIYPNDIAITNILQQQLSQLQQNIAITQSTLEEVKNAEDDWLVAQQRWFQWLDKTGAERLVWANLFSFETDNGEVETTNILNWLDLNLRHQLFILAVHYWEGRWLLAADQLDFTKPEKQHPQARQATWQRYAMLTPCFVTTLHSGPNFFDVWQQTAQPHYELIDLLIIDEAGQVAPDVAGAMFALAKKALAVGDIQQIEPVWSLTKVVDQGNAKRYQLINNTDEFNEFIQTGLWVSSGSVMTIAQRASHWQKASIDNLCYEPGLFLAEHRRCLPDIISYCNTLAYGGRLKACRPNQVMYPWPPMGIIHVAGVDKMVSGSRVNEDEARAVVEWLLEHADEIQHTAMQFYPGKSLDDLIGIVTPFVQQRHLILQLLKKANLAITKVGTVHALQGAERSLVIFSPVYTATTPGSYFFDRSKNILNVAVSRAKDSFVVIGDRGIFKAELKNLPSGLLVNWLKEINTNEF